MENSNDNGFDSRFAGLEIDFDDAPAPTIKPVAPQPAATPSPAPVAAPAPIPAVQPAAPQIETLTRVAPQAAQEPAPHFARDYAGIWRVATPMDGRTTGAGDVVRVSRRDGSTQDVILRESIGTNRAQTARLWSFSPATQEARPARRTRRAASAPSQMPLPAPQATQPASQTPPRASQPQAAQPAYVAPVPTPVAAATFEMRPSSASADAARIEQATRVAPQPAAQPAAQPTQARRHISEQLVAVASEEDATGLIVYWETAGIVDADRLRAELTTRGIGEKLLPEPASEEVCLRRAVKELGERGVLVRQHPAGGWVVVVESAVDGTLAYSVGTRFFLDAEGIKADAEEGAAVNEIALDRVRAEYAKQRGALIHSDIQTWLKDVVFHVGGTALRSSGGFYFVPRAAGETISAVRASLEACGAIGCYVYQIPAMYSADTARAIFDGIAAEMSTELSKIEGEMEVEMGPRAANTRLEKLDGLVAKIASYEQITRMDFAAARARIQTIRERLSHFVDRTSRLEIE